MLFIKLIQSNFDKKYCTTHQEIFNIFKREWSSIFKYNIFLFKESERSTSVEVTETNIKYTILPYVRFSDNSILSVTTFSPVRIFEILHIIAGGDFSEQVQNSIQNWRFPKYVLRSPIIRK